MRSCRWWPANDLEMKFELTKNNTMMWIKTELYKNAESECSFQGSNCNLKSSIPYHQPFPTSISALVQLRSPLERVSVCPPPQCLSGVRNPPVEESLRHY